MLFRLKSVKCLLKREIYILYKCSKIAFYVLPLVLLLARLICPVFAFFCLSNNSRDFQKNFQEF